jgi:hypothetical protein
MVTAHGRDMLSPAPVKERALVHDFLVKPVRRRCCTTPSSMRVQGKRCRPHRTGIDGSAAPPAFIPVVETA